MIQRKKYSNGTSVKPEGSGHVRLAQYTITGDGIPQEWSSPSEKDED